MERNPTNFIEQIIKEDLAKGFNKKNLRFRFPPEPNGYLHIGHAKAIGINFGLGEKYEAPVNLRFDDTNPTKEEQEYVDAIIEDIDWLNYTWDKITYSSDHFEKLYFSTSSTLFLQPLQKPSENIPTVLPNTSQHIPKVMKK